MADRTVRVRLSAEVGDYVAKLQQAGAATRKLADDTAKSAEQNKQAWSEVSTGLMAVGAVAVAGLGSAVKTYAEFDAQMSAVAATGDDAAQNITALRDAAKAAGAAFGQFSGKDAAKGIEELAKAGLSAQQILGGGLTGALSLAAAGEMEVGEAAEVTAKTLSQFKLGGEQAAHVADLLAAGAGKAVGDVHDMGEALKMTGTVANQYGVSVEETTGTLALFAQNALLGSDAGTSMKQMLLQLAKPTDEAQSSLDKLGIAAYDSQGKFVGMASLAEQLKTKLGGLSQEQQNAALKTIFGADAMRAATVLMAEGAAGVEEWTAAVNDQGYASEVAATKMDNLQGDLRALGGSWENLQIAMGEGANGPLRQATQQLTALLDAAGRHPEAAQTLALIGGGLGALALTAGALMKAVTAVSEFRSALATLKASEGIVGGVAGQLGSLAKAAAIAGGGLIALSIAGSAYQRSIDKQLSSTEKLNAAVLQMGRGGDLSTINADLQAMDTQVTDLGGAFDYLNKKTGWSDRLGADLGKAIPSVLGMKTAYAQYADEIDRVDKSLAALGQQDAAASFGAMLEQTGLSAMDAAAQLDDYRGKLEQQALALAQQVPSFDAAKLSAEDYARWMGGEVPASVVAAAEAARSMGGANAELADSFLVAAGEIQQTTEALLANAQAQLAASGGMIGLEAAIDQASASLAENGRNLDINTEAGRANRSALDQIASAGLNAAQSLRESGASATEVAGAQKRAAGSFIDAAKAAGMTAGKAVELAQKYGLIPDDVSTEIKSLWARGKYDEAMAALAKADGKTATTTITTKHVDIYTTYRNTITSQTAANQGAVGNGAIPPALRAAGGPIIGPGGPTDDLIPTLLSNGEHVLTAAEVNAYGGQDAVYRLRAAMRAGLVPRFAVGGGASDSDYTRISRMATAGPASGWDELAGAIRALAQASQHQVELQRSARQAQASSGDSKAAANAKVKSLQAKAQAEDLELREQLLAAQRSHNKKLAAKIAEQRKAADLSWDKQIAAAKAQAAKAGKGSKSAEQALERLAKATDLVRDRQRELADTQRQLADAARSASDQLQSPYQQGWDAADWAANMREGAGEISAFQRQLAQLASAGLDKSLIGELEGRGVREGSEVAASILAGGPQAIANVESAAAALKRAADKLGLQQATGRVAAPSMPASMGQASTQVAGARAAAPSIQINANGPDAREVVNHAVARMAHLQRLQAIPMPGG